MNEFIAIIFIRGLERLVAVLLGGSTIFMAYRLFLAIPYMQDSDQFRFRQYIQLHLFKIVVGAAFMMFGGFIIVTSLIRAPELQGSSQEKLQTEQIASTLAYSGMRINASSPVASTSPCPSKDSVLASIHLLNQLQKDLMAEVSGLQAETIHYHISSSKASIMESVWEEEEWGSWFAFRDWIDAGEDAHAIADLHPQAVSVFYSTSKQNP